MNSKDQRKLMRRSMVGGVVVLSLALFVALFVSMCDDRKPFFVPGIGVPVLKAKYPHRVYVSAIESLRGNTRGQLMVGSIHIGGFERAPNGSDYLPISSECDLSLVINGTPYNASSLTKTLLDSLGAEVDTTSYEDLEAYSIYDDKMYISILIPNDKPVRVVISSYVPTPASRPSNVESLAISWQGKEVRVLPISYSDCREYLGKPLSVKKWRAM